MDIHQLRVFVNVYKARSFSRAAQALGLSQPTISEHIKTLENELGCRLFDRVGRQIIPTEEAEKLYPGAVKIIDDVESLKEELQSGGRGLSGTLSIGASTIPGAYILPLRAAEFKRLHKGVSFEVIIEDSAKITQMVLGHQLLMAVVGAKPATDELSCEKMGEDEVVLVGRADLIDRDSVSIEELRTLPFILREKGSGTRGAFENFLIARGVSIQELNTVAVLGSTDAVKEALKNGLGFSFISRLAVKEELARGILKELKVEDFSIKRWFYLITHRKRTLPRVYKEFMAFLRTER